MRNNVSFYMTVIIIFTAILSRINIHRHEKNYNKLLNELKKEYSQYNNELNIITNYVKKHYEIQENNQGTYVLVLILTLGILYMNI
ncbi:hypothetical protein [Senegalia massiliensis]|uniref:Uncharacterized protein n=1 Tax=Senegalia massiliensis TaxID=1720316 RepID=A0A845QV99_9CLOT|nr:hypothetical protein [Senegalia massiliensis]NBI06445.1 hypothetical protein [Senegalia massiliensis]